MAMRTSRAKERSIVCLMLIVLTSSFYILSLEGDQDVEWIFDNVKSLSIRLLTSVVLFWANVIFVVREVRFSYSHKAVLLALMVFSMILLFVSDQGNQPYSHGAYNMICFITFEVPLFAATGLSMFLYRRFRIQTIIKSLCIFLVFYYIWLTAAHNKGEKIYMTGLWGREISSNDENCQFKPSTAWTEILPKGLISNFLGSDQCPYKDEFSTLENSLLTVTCDKTAKVMLLPDVTKFNATEKKYFAKSVNDGIQTFDYVEPVRVYSEAVAVQCGKHFNYHVQVIKKDSVIQRIEKKQQKKLNVMVLFWDAVSRAMFNRRLPNTKKFLENLQNNGRSNVYQFFRYHAVGLNTLNTSRALYTGEKTVNLKYEAMQETFRNNGFATFVSNDHCEDWSLKYRQTQIQMDHENGLFCMPEYHLQEDPESPFQGPFSMYRRCLGPKYVHTYEMDYLEKFWDTYRGYQKFGHSTFLEGHEGTGDILALADDYFEEFLGNLDAKNVFNDTAFFIVADHGLHQGLAWLFTEKGSVEHMLPAAYVSMPTWWEKEKQENLRKNEQRLISAFDFHRTWDELSGVEDHLQGTFGQSLFTEIKPRSCGEAGVPEAICKCH